MKREARATALEPKDDAAPSVEDTDRRIAPDDQRLMALASFERWSNYLLVATVAAAGWVVTSAASFHSGVMRLLAVWSFGSAIVFAIFTLALIPPLAEQIRDYHDSIYQAHVEYPLFTIRRRTYLRQVYQPQHVAFIAGTTFYCIGTARIWPLLGAVGFGVISFTLSKPGRCPSFANRRRVPSSAEHK